MYTRKSETLVTSQRSSLKEGMHRVESGKEKGCLISLTIKFQTSLDSHVHSFCMQLLLIPALKLFQVYLRSTTIDGSCQST
jgi:hypothetical protein